MKSLVEKLAEVMGAVGWIEKSGYNDFHRYKYAQEADLVNAIRGELSKRSIMVFPDVQEVKRSEHVVETSKGIRKTWLTEIAVVWTFVDGESDQKHSITVHGVGEDNMDKGFYKAFTGSEKYMLMKTFLIPTGDDPEKDSQEEAQQAKERGREAAQATGKAKVVAALASPDPKVRKIAEEALKPTTLFFTYPEKHNGNYAEFINIREFAAGMDQVAAEGLRQTFAPFLSKTKAKDGSVLIPKENMQALLEKLVGEAGIDVHELRSGE